MSNREIGAKFSFGFSDSRNIYREFTRDELFIRLIDSMKNLQEVKKLILSSIVKSVMKIVFVFSGMMFMILLLSFLPMLLISVIFVILSCAEMCIIIYFIALDIKEDVGRQFCAKERVNRTINLLKN